MIDLKNLSESDPLLRRAEKGLDNSEYSPMDPPDAYSPPGTNVLTREDMHPFIQHLMDEHEGFVSVLDEFEATLAEISQKGLSREANGKLGSFFQTFDDTIVVHSQKEDKLLFPRLQKRLLEIGHHSHSSDPHTAVDMLEDDHIKVMQLAAVTFNFFGLAARLSDSDSTAIVMDAAIEQGKALVEVLRLHFFREDTIVFPMAHQHLSTAELDALSSVLA